MSTRQKNERGELGTKDKDEAAMQPRAKSPALTAGPMDSWANLFQLPSLGNNSFCLT